MHNPFTKHPRDNNMGNYWQHCKSACGIGIRLYITAFIFIIHGIFPFIKIPKWVNLTDSASYLLKENEKRH